MKFCMHTLSLLRSFALRRGSASFGSGTPLQSMGFCSTTLQTSVEQNADIIYSDNYEKSEEDYSGHKTRARSRRFALLLSFCGFNYSGMQYNTGTRTIEGEFFRALHLTGYCDKNYHVETDVAYNRVSRTDSGVSALRQVISLKLPSDMDINEINMHLPSDIRVLGALQVSQSFHARKACSTRSYCYVIPTFALCYHKMEPEHRYSYRVDVDTIFKVNDLLSKFVGTHRFHNYTKSRDMMDPRSLRSIKEFYCSDPYLFEETEVIEFHVTGVSFMLHHIRKMVGMTVAIMRGKAGINELKQTLTAPRMPTPLAPGIGLFLENVSFDKFNTKATKKVCWEALQKEVEEFKMDNIVPTIVQQDRKNKIMEEFLDSELRRHSFRDNRDVKVEDEEAAIRREIEEINLLVEEAEGSDKDKELDK